MLGSLCSCSPILHLYLCPQPLSFINSFQSFLLWLELSDVLVMTASESYFSTSELLYANIELDRKRMSALKWEPLSDLKATPAHRQKPAEGVMVRGNSRTGRGVSSLKSQQVLEIRMGWKLVVVKKKEQFTAKTSPLYGVRLHPPCLLASCHFIAPLLNGRNNIRNLH